MAGEDKAVSELVKDFLRAFAGPSAANANRQNAVETVFNDINAAREPGEPARLLGIHHEEVGAHTWAVAGKLLTSARVEGDNLRGTDQYNDLFAPEREEKVQTYIAQMVNPLLYRAAKKEARDVSLKKLDENKQRLMTADIDELVRLVNVTALGSNAGLTLGGAGGHDDEADESDVYDSDDGYKSDGPSVRLAPDEHPTSDPKEQAAAAAIDALCETHTGTGQAAQARSIVLAMDLLASQTQAFKIKDPKDQEEESDPQREAQHVARLAAAAQAGSSAARGAVAAGLQELLQVRDARIGSHEIPAAAQQRGQGLQEWSQANMPAPGLPGGAEQPNSAASEEA